MHILRDDRTEGNDWSDGSERSRDSTARYVCPTLATVIDYGLEISLRVWLLCMMGVMCVPRLQIIQ